MNGAFPALPPSAPSPIPTAPIQWKQRHQQPTPPPAPPIVAQLIPAPPIAGLAVESKTSAAERRLLNNASAVPSTSAAATGSGMKGSRHASSDESKAPGNVIFSNSR